MLPLAVGRGWLRGTVTKLPCEVPEKVLAGGYCAAISGGKYACGGVHACMRGGVGTGAPSCRSHMCGGPIPGTAWGMH
jgi:hypothetical protein